MVPRLPWIRFLLRLRLLIWMQIMQELGLLKRVLVLLIGLLVAVRVVWLSSINLVSVL